MRVLIAEDNAPSRKLLKHLIKPLENYQIVGEAVNGEDLINKVMTEKPDLVIVDINMPLLNGMEAVKSCKKMIPSLQVIFTTSIPILSKVSFTPLMMAVEKSFPAKCIEIAALNLPSLILFTSSSVNCKVAAGTPVSPLGPLLKIS